MDAATVARLIQQGWLTTAPLALCSILVLAVMIERWLRFRGIESKTRELTRSVVEVVSERAEGSRVTRVRLQIGKRSAVMPDAIRFCFDLCAEGTAAQGAQLEIEETAGDELLIREMEIEPCA